MRNSEFLLEKVDTDERDIGYLAQGHGEQP